MHTMYLDASSYNSFNLAIAFGGAHVFPSSEWFAWSRQARRKVHLSQMELFPQSTDCFVGDFAFFLVLAAHAYSYVKDLLHFVRIEADIRSPWPALTDDLSELGPPDDRSKGEYAL